MSEENPEVEDDNQFGEFFWGCELRKDKPSVTWSVQEEDDDTDFMQHTLFLKNAVLGAQSVKDEVNIVQLETQNYDKETIKQPFISLTRGESSMCSMDISFTDKCPVTFSLTDGTGPVYISAVHLVEFPNDGGDLTMDETEYTEEDSPEKPKLKAKRKGGAAIGASKAKRSKMEASGDGASDEGSEEDDEEDDDDDDEEMDEEDDDDDDEEPTPEKKKVGKKKNAKGATKAGGKKAEKPKAKKAGGARKAKK